MERWSGGCADVVWRLWRGGLEAVEMWSGGCEEVIWRMWTGGLEAMEI